MPKDNALAVKWWQRAAIQNDREAMYQLGIMFANGLGVRRPDESEAIRWWTKAAHLGHPDCQTILRNPASRIDTLENLWTSQAGIKHDAEQAAIARGKPFEDRAPFRPPPIQLSSPEAQKLRKKLSDHRAAIASKRDDAEDRENLTRMLLSSISAKDKKKLERAIKKVERKQAKAPDFKPLVLPKARQLLIELKRADPNPDEDNMSNTDGNAAVTAV